MSRRSNNWFSKYGSFNRLVLMHVNPEQYNMSFQSDPCYQGPEYENLIGFCTENRIKIYNIPISQGFVPELESKSSIINVLPERADDLGPASQSVYVKKMVLDSRRRNEKLRVAFGGSNKSICLYILAQAMNGKNVHTYKSQIGDSKSNWPGIRELGISDKNRILSEKIDIVRIDEISI